MYMSEVERQYLTALIEVADGRVAELTAICQNSTADSESEKQLVRWTETLACCRSRLRCGNECLRNDPRDRQKIQQFA